MQQYIRTIDRYLSGINQGDYELEIRFGEFWGKQFKSSNEPKIFYRMLSYFLTHKDIYEYIPQEVSVITEEMLGIQVPHAPDTVTERIYVDKYNQTIREAVVEGLPNAPKFYSLKDKFEPIDNTWFYHRFAIAKEQNLGERYTLPENVFHQATREKKRWSFALNKTVALKSDAFKVLKHLRIDLTHVTGWKITPQGQKVLFNDFEIEAEIIDKPVVYERDVAPGVLFLLQLYQNTRYIIPSYEVSNLISNFNRLFTEDINALVAAKRKQEPKWRFNQQWKLYNPVNKPVNLKLDHLHDISNLAITDKADGERKLLFVSRDGIYVVYPPADIIKFSNTSIPGLTDTILDGELVITKNGEQVFLPFDVLFYRGIDKRGNKFEDRIKILESLQQVSKNIQPKKFYYTGNFYTNVNTLLDTIGGKPYGNDGIIINQLNGDYSSDVYKWKPIDLLTIDFNVEKIRENEYKLYVKSGKSLQLFIGNDKHPFSGIISTELALNTGQIVEMGWRDGTFVPLRIRHDRDQPNNLSTSLSIWNDINRPIEEATIRGTNLVMLRQLHNNIKKRMLESCRDNYLLDIGSGRGGDLHKWKPLNLKVFAVEPSLENIQEFQERLEESGYKYDETTGHYIFDKTHVRIMNGRGQDTEDIVRGYKSSYDTPPGYITIFNALTFFFESEESLNALIDTIDSLLPSGGSFMGMVMDGDAVKQMMGTLDTIEQVSWKIKKMGDFTESPYGNKIYIDLEDTIVQNQVEYLVDFKEFTKKLAEKGIHVDTVEMLSSKNLSPSQSALYNLYKTFKFKKQIGAISAAAPTISSVEETLKHLYVSQSSVHLNNLGEEDREPIVIGGKQFIRIGTESDNILAAVARSAFEIYEMKRNTSREALSENEMKTRDKIVNLFMSKLMIRLEREYKDGEALEEFDSWEAAKQFLSGNKLHWLNLLDIIGKACSINIVYVMYYDSIRPPKITTTELDNFNYVVVFSNDGYFDSLAHLDENNNVLITQFPKNPLV